MAKIGSVADAMSDVLGLVRMRGEFVCANEFAAPWSLAFDVPLGHFHIVEAGSGWLSVTGGEPVRVNAGDVLLLPLGAGHVLASDLALEPTLARLAFASGPTSGGAVYRLGGDGEETHVICGQFAFGGPVARRLLALLPPLIHVRCEGGEPREWVRLMSAFIIEETRRPRPGSSIMVSRLLELLFVQTLRDWAAQQNADLSWLSGLVDPQIGRALSAMHEAPGRAWTVEGLSRVAGLSRSAFAARFTALVGAPPLGYLTNWRMHLAADLLKAGAGQVAEVAAHVGYGSEAAFSRAFKGQFGETPAAYRRKSAPDRQG